MGVVYHLFPPDAKSKKRRQRRSCGRRSRRREISRELLPPGDGAEAGKPALAHRQFPLVCVGVDCFGLSGELLRSGPGASAVLPDKEPGDVVAGQPMNPRIWRVSSASHINISARGSDFSIWIAWYSSGKKGVRFCVCVEPDLHYGREILLAKYPYRTEKNRKIGVSSTYSDSGGDSRT